MEFRPIDYFTRADEAAKRGDIDGEIDILKELVSLCQLSDKPADYYAEALRWLGNAYQTKNNIPLAHSYRLEASHIIEQLGPDCNDYVAMCVNGDLGRSFIELNEWSQAEFHTRRALAIAEAMKDIKSKRSGLCIYRMNLGLIMSNLGDNDEAIRLGEQVLSDAELLDEPYYVLALQNLNLASMYMHANHLNVAQKYTRRGMVYAEFRHDSRIKKRARKILGDNYLRGWRATRQTEYATEAERLLKQAAIDARQDEDFHIVADTELDLAELTGGRNRADLVAVHCEQAIDALEKARSVLGFEEFSQTYFGHWERVYDSVVAFQLRHQDAAAAFLTSERSRSRLLLARLGSARLNVTRWAEEQQSELRSLLDRYGTEVVRFRRSELTRGHSSSRTLGLRASTPDEASSDPPEIADARTSYLRLQDKQRLYSAHWSNRLISPVASHTEVQQRLGPDDAMVIFHVGESSVFVFALTAESLQFSQVPYPPLKLAQDVDEVCGKMTDLKYMCLARLSHPRLREEWERRQLGQPHPEDIERPLRGLRSALDKLFAIVVAPVVSALDPKRNWIIVPHGPLHRIPWASMWTGTRYLVETHNIALLPSASFAPALKQEFNGDGEGVLLLGAPDVGEDDPLSLPGALSELSAAQHALRLSDPPEVGPRATKACFLAKARSVRLIHLAAHHYFDGTAPGLSFLKLAGDRGEGFVYASEVAEMRLRAQLVILSACETARSRVLTGDEQYGMVRSFIAAGARSIISTLWEIEDKSAALMFTEFYRLATQVPLCEALAEVQRSFLRKPLYDVPYFWAPYVLSGDWTERFRLQ